MIQSKAELKQYINADKKVNGMSHEWLKRLTWNDSYRVHKHIYLLRKLEYYTNCPKWYNVHLKLYYQYRYRKSQVKTGMVIFPNTMGAGLQLMHPGFRRVGRMVKAGKNCTLLPMVLFGRKRPTDIDSEIIIGDNCYISTGVTILGPVKIGNNVTIGAGAVVVNDIPDNCVVVGVPAKIIKIIEK